MCEDNEVPACPPAVPRAEMIDEKLLISVEQHSAKHHYCSFQHPKLCSFCERSPVILKSTQLKGTHKCGWSKKYLCCHCYQYYTKDHNWSVPQEFYEASRHVKDSAQNRDSNAPLDMLTDQQHASPFPEAAALPHPGGLELGTEAISVSQAEARTVLDQLPEYIEHCYSRIQEDLQFILNYERRRAESMPDQGEDRFDRIEKLLTIQRQIVELQSDANPPSLMGGWIEYIDPDSRRQWYWNESTRECRVADPARDGNGQ